MREDVLRIVEGIPYGRVATYCAIAEHLGTVPRHVAYLLAQLDPEENARIPWHRAIPTRVLRPDQRAKLENESVAIDTKGMVARLGEVAWPADAFPIPARNRTYLEELTAA